MEILVIGKPAVNIYLPLQEFPQEGDIFTIKTKQETVGNVGATAACVLGKWGLTTHFTGVLGKDSYADKIRDTFAEYKVDSKFLEANYDKQTCLNYIILNSKDGGLTKIQYNDPSVMLTKYKYDFTPNMAILDGTDYAGAQAFLNNIGGCTSIYYARLGNKEDAQLSKRTSYCICTQICMENMVHMSVDGSAEGYVAIYQKLVDIGGHSNYIVILNNHKILYSVDGKVKILPEMKINVVDYSSFDSVFVGAFTFGLANNLSVDDAIKFANTASAISISKMGEVPSIPTLDEVLDNSGLREKLGMAQEKASSVIKPQEVTPLNPTAMPAPAAPTNQPVTNPSMPNGVPSQAPAPTPETNPTVNAFSTQPIANPAPVNNPNGGNNNVQAN